MKVNIIVSSLRSVLSFFSLFSETWVCASAALTEIACQCISANCKLSVLVSISFITVLFIFAVRLTYFVYYALCVFFVQNYVWLTFIVFYFFNSIQFTKNIRSAWDIDPFLFYFLLHNVIYFHLPKHNFHWVLLYSICCHQ